MVPDRIFVGGRELSPFMRKVVIGALMVAVSLLMAIGGCAYELYQVNRVVNPDRLSGVRTVAVAPFRYANDWTGYFRDIYRDAGLDSPAVKKIDRIEATFLTESVLLKRGYKLLAWPVSAEDIEWETGKLGEKLKDLLVKIRESGADAVLLQRGRSHCPKMHSCKAEIEMKLLDSANCALLWEGKGTGETLLAHGDEMRAAVEEVLSSLPRPLRKKN